MKPDPVIMAERRIFCIALAIAAGLLLALLVSTGQGSVRNQDSALSGYPGNGPSGSSRSRGPLAAVGPTHPLADQNPPDSHPMDPDPEAMRMEPAAPSSPTEQHCRAEAELMWHAIRERFGAPTEHGEAFVNDMTANLIRKSNRKPPAIIPNPENDKL